MCNVQQKIYKKKYITKATAEECVWSANCKTKWLHFNAFNARTKTTTTPENNIHKA